MITTKITWSREISRIVSRQCAGCHNGGPAFSLLSYAEARPWAKAIKDEVLARRMPPWNAVKGFGDFKNDHGLTQDDLAILSEWVDGGAPEGNPLALPPKPRREDNEEDESPAGQNVTFTGSMVFHSQRC
ncbi:MAG: cytochrome c [Candidatus Solibacter sp.]